MSDLIKKILVAPSISNETMDESLQRMSIPDDYSDAMVISELVKIYANNPSLNGDASNIVQRLSSKIVAQSSAQTEKIKVSDNEKEKKMNEDLNLEGLDGAVEDMKKVASSNPGAQGAKKESTSKVVELEAGAQELKQKAVAAMSNPNNYQVTDVYAKKESRRALVLDYNKSNKKAVYADKKQVNGVVGYLVKQRDNGTFDRTALNTRVNALISDITAKFGYDASSRTCSQPAYNAVVPALVDKLTNAQLIVSEETRAANLPENFAGKEGTYELLAGNTSFLADIDNISDKKSIQGMKLSTGETLTSSKLSEKMYRDNIPMLHYSHDANVAFIAKANTRLDKGKTKVQFYTQVLGRDRIKPEKILVANQMIAGKKNWVKVPAKIDDELKYTEVNTKGKNVTKKFKILVFVPVFGNVNNVANINCQDLYLKKPDISTGGRKVVTKDYFNDKEYLENKFNSFANSLNKIKDFM